MLFPENPIHRPELWNNLAQQLSYEPMCYVISNGTGDPETIATLLSSSEQERILQRMQKAEICRISANRGVAVSPHFAAILNGQIASLIELVTSPSQAIKTVLEEKLKNDLAIVIINLLYTNRNIHTVLVSLNIPVWQIKDIEVQSSSLGLIFKREE